MRITPLAACVSFCELTITASARALAQMNRFFIMLFYVFAALRGGYCVSDRLQSWRLTEGANLRADH